MEADWDEIAQTTLPPPGPHALSTPVASLAFDPCQELVWTGNPYGRVTSFYGPELQKYTSFRAHPTNEGSIRAVLVNEKGVISISSKSVHFAIRRGLPEWHVTHEKMTDLRCMSYTSKGTSEILVAGWQNVMFVIDVDKGVITREIETTSNYSIMRLSRYICAATTAGFVDIIDSTKLTVIKSWKAHGTIHDMDTQNFYLVTCGHSNRQHITMTGMSLMMDPLAQVFDLRSLAPLPPIPFPAGAAYVRLHPRMVTTGIIASQQGQLQLVDLMNPNAVTLRQANVQSPLTHMELSSSGQALILADQECLMHLWGSSTQQIRFCEVSNPVEFADVVTPLPQIDWTADTPLSSVGLPYYRETLLSAWPSNLVFEVGHPPPKVDPDLLADLTPMDIGGYARNRKGLKRNVVETAILIDTSSRPLIAPKFLSEKAREPGTDGSNERRISDAVEALGEINMSDLKAQVPLHYRNVEIKYSRFGVDDFDFEFYNRTHYSGLETHIANSYSNSLLQLLRFVPLARNIALQHAATSCLSEHCLLCELGFLFDMLESANGLNCQATNFLKTFSSLPQAAQLGLLEEDSPSTALTTVIQNMNRFLLERVSVDYKEISPASPTLDSTFRTSAITSIRCLSCHTETMREGGSYVTELTYARRAATTKAAARIPQPTFSEVLKASIECEIQTRGWCDKCRKYQPLTTRKSIQSIPSVLMLNAAIHSAEAKKYWGIPNWLPSSIGLGIENGSVLVCEGAELTKRLEGPNSLTVYELVGFVADIDSGEHQTPHLVSLINVNISSRRPASDSDSTDKDEAQWYLFNDFLVRRVPATDALSFHPTWKLPSILTYQVRSASHSLSDAWKSSLSTSLLYTEWSTNGVPPHPTTRLLDPSTEAPSPGTLVAIDSEFVALQREEIEIKADGTRETIRPSRLALARVSVCRGAGMDEGIPFIDDYIVTSEPVVDYVTAFSGIRAGDLSPKTSTHPLVPLKVAYKKLWLLRCLGCVFVGHGLIKDFRTINMHVPKSQVVDTVVLFQSPTNRRKLKLRFLAWLLLRQDIQTADHDSVEDARSALALYRKFLEFQEAGVFEERLEDVYRKGRELGFNPPSASAATVAANTAEGIARGENTPPPMYQQPGGSMPGTPSRRPALLREPGTPGRSEGVGLSGSPLR